MIQMCRCGHPRGTHKFVRGQLNEPCELCKCPDFRLLMDANQQTLNGSIW